MMCTVAELIAELQKYPDDAIVEVLKEYSNGYDVFTTHDPVDVEYFSTCVRDYRNDDNYKNSEYYNKVFIQLEAK